MNIKLKRKLLAGEGGTCQHLMDCTGDLDCCMTVRECHKQCAEPGGAYIGGPCEFHEQCPKHFMCCTRNYSIGKYCQEKCPWEPEAPPEQKPQKDQDAPQQKEDE